MNTAPSASQNARPAALHPRARKFSKLRISVLAAGLLVAASVAAQKSESQETLVRRYPFDPACPWGRVANGKGMIVRCMSEEEANLVLKRLPSASAAPATGAVSGGAVAPPPAAASATPAAEAPAEADSADVAATDQKLDVSVGPVVADQGELSVGKLNQPKSRYVKCVTDHGGLKDKAGQVDVRFLVRSKGIAEGVSVQKRVNMSADAARCVAEVVDRRRVGVPDAPLVGATVTIKFEKLAK